MPVSQKQKLDSRLRGNSEPAVIPAQRRRVGAPLYPQGVGRGCKGINPQQRTLCPRGFNTAWADKIPAHPTPSRSRFTGRERARGFSLVTAIFLLVVLSALGAMMVTFSTAQQKSSSLDMLGSRAYQAARAGVEWAAFGVSQTPAETPWAGCVPETFFPVNTLGGTLAPFLVKVECTSGPYTDGATIYVYDITSTATGVNGAAPGGADYVERVINVKMGR